MPTHENDVAELVAAARTGDPTGLERLITRFQGMATGYAFSRLGDVDRARDAVQESFIDAYLRLDQLRQPAAFGGWLRRIVHKHCDRITRRAQPVTTDSVVAEAVDSAATPERALATANRSAWLKRAIEDLPEHERAVVALHYVAGHSQAEAASFLGLELSAAKKRLFSARQRLKDRSIAMNNPSIDRAHAALPAMPSLAPAIALFINIRSGDHQRVRMLLRQHPELLEGEEHWSDEEALARHYDLAHHATPLVLAAGRGDLHMVELLLELGADPEGRCGCANSETALWAATKQGANDVVERLLRAGACPNARNEHGDTPLHLAAMRGRTALIDLLLGAGSEADRRSFAGRTPLDCARDNHHHDAVERLGGALVEPTAAAPCAPLVTGIKALDLFTPLAEDTIVRITGGAETGLMVLIAELTQSIANRGGAAVWVGWESLPWHQGELDIIARDYGVENAVTVVTGPDAGDARFDAGVSTMDRALSAVRARRNEHELVALFVFQRAGHEATVQAAYPKLLDSATIAFVIDPWREVTTGERQPPKTLGPHNTVICTDRAMADAGCYPAIQPLLSRSAMFPDAQHRTLVEAARCCLAAGGPAAERLRAYLTQPFVVAEPITSMPGEAVALVDTLDGVRRIVAGELNHREADSLRYCGAI